MKFHAKQEFKEDDDRLYIAKYLGVIIFQPKAVRLFIAFQLISEIFLIFYQIYYMFFKLNKREVIRYGSVFFGSFYPIAGLYYILFKSDIYKKYFGELSPWSYDSGTEKTKLSIYKEMRIISFLSLVVFILACMAGLCFALPEKSDYEFFLPLRILKDYFPRHYYPFWIIYKCTYPSKIIMSITGIYSFVYGVYQTKAQWMILTDHFSKLMYLGYSNIVKTELFYNEDYQKEIRCRLIYCIKIHQSFVRGGLILLEEGSSYIAPFAIAGWLFGVGFILFLIADEPPTTLLVLTRLGLIGCLSGLMFSAIIEAGQTIENEWAKIYSTVLQMDWYYMNSINKELYVILITFLQKPQEFRFSTNVAANYTLGLGIVKGIYSVISVFASTRG